MQGNGKTHRDDGEPITPQLPAAISPRKTQRNFTQQNLEPFSTSLSYRSRYTAAKTASHNAKFLISGLRFPTRIQISLHKAASETLLKESLFFCVAWGPPRRISISLRHNDVTDSFQLLKFALRIYEDSLEASGTRCHCVDVSE